MNIRRLITFAALGALALAATELPAQERERRERSHDRDREAQILPSTRPGVTAAGYAERYAIIEQRNVFVKDRSRPTTRPSSPTAATQPAKRSAEESLVVRGIAMEDAGYRAYVEDLNTNATLRLSPGDVLARGRVASISLDAIAYEQDGGAQTWINIGHDLTGKRSETAATVVSSAASSSTTGPSTLPANVDINDPNLTVEQRMRLRVQLQNRGR